MGLRDNIGLSLPTYYLLSFFKGNITERFKYESDIGFISPLFAQEMLQALCFDGLKTLYGFNQNPKKIEEK